MLSRYVDHPFFTDWQTFKNNVDTFDSNELSGDLLKEFLRFKKAVDFLNVIINNVDPELIPKNILDNARNYLNNTQSQFNSFKSSKNISYIQGANNYIDNVLSILRPHIFYDKKLRQSLKAVIKEYIEEINKHLENIANTEVEYEKAKELREKIEEYYDELFEGIESEEPLKIRIDELFRNIEKEYQEINEFYNETLIDHEEESIKTQIEEAKKEILSDVEEAKEKLTEVSSKIDELDKFYVKIFGSLNEETDSREGGLKQELEARIKELDAYKENQEKLFKELIENKKKELEEYDKNQREKHDKLFHHIESLLPGATSAGLAKAYQERRKTYFWPILFWDFIFVISLAGIFFGGYITLKDFKDINETLKHLLEYSPLYASAIWLAFYASKRRSEYFSFEEEYAHKEALAKSYSSYKKQIEELGKDQDDLMNKLLDKTIETVATNPTTQVLDRDHGDKHPIIELSDKTVEKFGKFITNIIENKLKGSK